METKKILLYTGGAIALGAVAFFVWSFFQKVEIPLGNTTIGLGTSPDEAPIGSNPNTNPTDVIDDNDFPPVASNTNNSGIPPKFDPNVNNPFQPLDDQAYSDLDAFIHKGV
jgi:hypothetical protein